MKRIFFLIASTALFACGETTTSEETEAPAAQAANVEELIEAADSAGFIANDETQALQLYQEAVESAPENAGIIRARADYHLYLEAWMAALSDYKKAIELDPFDVEAHFFAGMCHEELNNSKSALELYSQTIALDSTYANAYFSRGKLLIKLGKKEEGCPDLYRADSYGNSEIYFNLLDSLCIKGKEAS